MGEVRSGSIFFVQGIDIGAQILHLMLIPYSPYLFEYFTVRENLVAVEHQIFEEAELCRCEFDWS